LAASGEDITAPRTSHKRWNARVPQSLLKRRDSLFARRGEVDSWSRIQGYEIYFAAQPAQQLGNFLCTFWKIIHASE